MKTDGQEEVMQELRKGQKLQERSGKKRLVSVWWNWPASSLVTVQPEAGHGVRRFDIPYAQAAKWEILPPPARRISLTLAADTTATECGACSFVDEHCRIFQARVRVYDHVAGRERNQRLPECVAAEAK